MGDQKRTRAIRVSTLTTVIILGLVSISNAMEVGFTAQNMVTVSDNINRAPNGLEETGSRIIMQGDFNLSSDLGSGSLDFGVGRGWESQNNGEYRNTDNFNSLLNVNLPWSGTGYIEGLASTRDDIVDPELTDISQVRVRTKTTLARFEIGKQDTPTINWQMALNNRTERRFDRDLDESWAELGWDVSVDRSHNVAFNVDFHRGKEAFEEDSWTRFLLSVDLRKALNRISARGYRLTLEGEDLSQADGTNEVTDIVTALAYYETEMSSGWLLTGELGVDGIKPIVDNRYWRPRVEIGLSGMLDRQVQFDGSLSTSSIIQDPLEDQISWTRDSQVRTGLVWSVSRAYTVEPSVHFRFAELFGNGISDMNEKTYILRLGSRWIPARNWSIDLNALREDRTNSQDAFNFSESRLELNFSGTFF